MKPKAPGDWAVERLETVAEVILSNVDKKSSSDELPVRLCNYMDVYANARITADLPFMEATATPAQVERFGLRVGDVVITKDSEDPSDIAVPSVVVDKFDGAVVCGYHLAILRPGRVDGPYLSWTLRSRPVNDQFTRRANGSTRFGLTSDVIRSAWIPLPPLAEQRKIATILSSVDDAIAATRKVIEQTKRVKQGLLQTLMTRGIGHTRFKKTEIGEIPEEWELAPADDLCEKISVGIVVRPAALYVDSGVPCVRSANISPDGIVDSDWVWISEESSQAHAKSILRAGDVIVVRTGEPGVAAVVPEWLDECNCIDVIFARPRVEKLDPYFLALFLNSYPGRSQVLQRRGGLAQKHLNVGALKRMQVPVPPLAEQGQIIKRIQAAQEAKVAGMSGVASLQNLRRGLMQDLLTGRVRVQSD